MPENAGWIHLLSWTHRFAVLRRFARPRLPVERCELCSAEVAHEHPHLLEMKSRQIVCACEACSTLFDGMSGGKYKRVSAARWLLKDFSISEGDGKNLLIPINMAFFFFSSTHRRMVALYPSPRARLSPRLPLDAWKRNRREKSAAQLS